MNKLRLLALCATAGLLASSAFAQSFIGSDDFNSGATAKWDYSFSTVGSGGSLDFANNRLEFTKGTGSANFFRVWDSDGTGSPSVVSTSFTSSWVLNVTATLNGITPGTGEFVTFGINLENDNGNYSALMFGINPSNTFVQAEGTGFSTVNSSLGSTASVFLQMSWNASSQALNAAYSLDGNSYTSVATFHPVSEWPGGTTANGFNFELFGNSNLAASIGGGAAYLDNFSVSAVPEPSTYAAFAGLGALGLALWRKRRKAVTVATEA